MHHLNKRMHCSQDTIGLWVVIIIIMMRPMHLTVPAWESLIKSCALQTPVSLLLYLFSRPTSSPHVNLYGTSYDKRKLDAHAYAHARLAPKFSLNANKQSHASYFLRNQGFKRGVGGHKQLIPGFQGAHLPLGLGFVGIWGAHQKLHGPFDHDNKLVPIFRPPFQCRPPRAYHLNELKPALRPVRLDGCSCHRQRTKLLSANVVMVFMRAGHHVCSVTYTFYLGFIRAVAIFQICRRCADGMGACSCGRWDVLGRPPVPSVRNWKASRAFTWFAGSQDVGHGFNVCFYVAQLQKYSSTACGVCVSFKVSLRTLIHAYPYHPPCTRCCAQPCWEDEPHPYEPMYL